MTTPSRLLRLSLGLICACAAPLAFAAVPAAAAGTLHPFLGDFGGVTKGSGNFGNPARVAIDESDGPSSEDVYLTDQGNEGYGIPSALYKFAPDGSPAPFADLGGANVIKTTPTGRLMPVGVAVNPANGDIYVADWVPNKPDVIDVFSSTGNYIFSFTPVGQEGAQTPKAIMPAGVAFDPVSGDVYVSDQGNDTIFRFHPDGTYVSQFSGSGEHAVSTPPNIAVDASGSVYVVSLQKNVVEKFDSEGNYLSTLDTNRPINHPLSVAVDYGTGEIEVYDEGTGTREKGVHDESSETVIQFDSMGNVENHFGFDIDDIGTFPKNFHGTGIAVNSVTHHVYVSDPHNDGGIGRIFDGILPGPIVATEPPSELTTTSARLNGTVNPHGFDVDATDPANCHFEWGTSKEYDHTASCLPAEDLGSGQEPKAVHAGIEGLTPGTTYHFRLDATNSEEEVKSADRTFNALGPPQINATSATDISGTSASLGAQINPDGFETTYHFEYGTADCSIVPDPCASIPVPDAPLGSGTEDKAASIPLSGLTPDATYHIRVIASNEAGTTTGPDRTFTTSHGFGLLPGIGGFDGGPFDQNSSPDNQAGSHPDQLTTTLNFKLTNESVPAPDGNPKDVHTELPPGLIGNPSVVGQCTLEEFTEGAPSNKQFGLSGENCPDDSQIGTVSTLVNLTSTNEGLGTLHFGVYNLVPPPGTPAQLGFNPIGLAVRLTPRVRPNDFGLTVASINTPQAVRVYGVSVKIWGTPWAHSHDGERGSCLQLDGTSLGSCPVSGTPRAYLTLPTACEGPTSTGLVADSWGAPGAYLPTREPDLTDPIWQTSTFTSHDNATPPNPVGMEGCNQLAFNPVATAKPTTDSAYSPTGLDFSLDVNDEGLTNPEGLSQSYIKKVAVTLPEGMSLNPSAGDGLGVCAPADFARETLDSGPGEGCPNSAKVGNVRIDTPLLPTPVPGAIYIAKPYENPFNSLLALYMVAKDPNTGVLVKVPGRLEANEVTGQLKTIFDDLPQLPFSHFNLHFSEGQHSPLASPPVCGTYTLKADVTPWANPDSVLHDTSSFTVTKGAGGGPCPSGATPPFDPQTTAGSYSNAAGAHSPFYVKMTRKDGEQEITSFSAHLPPGLSGKLAGIPPCSDATIEAAKQKTGTEEEEHPTCPKSSEVGHTLAGFGVGGILTYAPGKIYLAGPYHGSPISIASVTAAKVGPFDLGTIVVRSAFKIDPETAKVSVDAKGSDPIPHIIKGFPVHVRDIRVYVDRPDFTLNPTSCDPFSVATTLTGSGANFASPTDDVPASQETPYQASNCAALPFGPKLSFKLKGATKRSGHPALTATLTARPGEANIAKAAVTLPHSEFLDQAHIKTVCTRVQFAQNQCPPGSVYGFAKAVTPLLDKPLEGPVYLRSSNNPLPDLVVDLGGQIHVVLDGRVDSVKGGIRNTFEAVPDAPVKTFTLTMQGGKKGLLENSKNLCESVSRATVRLSGQNGKLAATHPEVIAQGCAKQGKRHKRGKRGAHRAHHG